MGSPRTTSPIGKVVTETQGHGEKVTGQCHVKAEEPSRGVRLKTLDKIYILKLQFILGKHATYVGNTPDIQGERRRTSTDYYRGPPW